MPTVLKKYEFKQRTIGRSVYDWGKLLDGTTYKLTKGESEGKGDYHCETASMKMMLYKQAEKNECIIQIEGWEGTKGKPDEGKEGLVIKATVMTDDQKKVLKKKLAARKARKEAKKNGTPSTNGDGLHEEPIDGDEPDTDDGDEDEEGEAEDE